MAMSGVLAPNSPVRMMSGKKSPFWKNMVTLHSGFTSFPAMKRETSVSRKATAVKPAHQSGSCHQFGKLWGLKLMTMLAKTVAGKAISMTSVERTEMTFSGKMRRRVIHRPMKPIPSSTRTDWRTTLKICIRS